ncbi:MAG TPA: preprotein translocase subunit SecG [Burkholderiales bacterium]|nr:preprotein translocase subunit SecG [Burkholderiales bacterium]
METVILIFHVLAALCVIGLVLLQHGKGADMGAAFGSGSAGSLFGSSGSANFLSRTTAIVAGVFFLTSLGLTYVSSHKGRSEGVMSTHQELPVEPAKSVPAPAVPVPGAPAQGAPASQPAGGDKANEIPK